MQFNTKFSAIHALKAYSSHVFASKYFVSNMPSYDMLKDIKYDYLKQFWLLEYDYASKFTLQSSANAQRFELSLSTYS